MWTDILNMNVLLDKRAGVCYTVAVLNQKVHKPGESRKGGKMTDNKLTAIRAALQRLDEAAGELTRQWPGWSDTVRQEIFPAARAEVEQVEAELWAADALVVRAARRQAGA